MTDLFARATQSDEMDSAAPGHPGVRLPTRITETARNYPSEIGLLAAFVVLVIALSVTAKGFLAVSNILLILEQMSPVLLVAVPFSLLLIARQVDLSIGSSIAVLAVVGARLIVETSIPVWIVSLLVVAGGALIGAFNGFLTARLGLSALIVTLGMLAALRGLAYVAQGDQYASGFGREFSFIGQGRLHFLDIPIPTVIALLVLAGGIAITNGTRWGRHVRAAGAGPDAAFLAGIRVRHVAWSIYILTGVGVGLATLIIMSNIDSGPATLASGFEITVLTAVLLGGIAFEGGRGTLIGVALGVLFLQTLSNGFTLWGLSTNQVLFANGAILVVAAALQLLAPRLRSRPTKTLHDRPIAREIEADDDALERAISEHTAAEDHKAEVALELNDVNKSFGSVHVLKNISLKIHYGEVVGLLGDNGAGKSTLVKCISGTHAIDSGEIRVADQRRVFTNPSDAREAGIETVFQELALIPELDVSGNLFLGRERLTTSPLGRMIGWLDRKGMRAEAEATLRQLGISLVSSRVAVSQLSGGQRQSIAVGRAVAWGKKVVLLDEPAAALGVEQAAHVLHLIDRLKSHGVAVVLISHNMQHVLDICSRVVVLRHGEKVADTDARNLKANDLVSLITGAETQLRGV
ncbi:ATP-binding cassette domain-containing protein [Mycolicibacterium sp.]|uniref:ATP-binding cassette domain-containing protein n=1 Tax=Mycolicibacterium sp. TaxID=2320850 RepID=UPI003D0CF296